MRVEVLGLQPEHLLPDPLQLLALRLRIAPARELLEKTDRLLRLAEVAQRADDLLHRLHRARIELQCLAIGGDGRLGQLFLPAPLGELQVARHRFLAPAEGIREFGDAVGQVQLLQPAGLGAQVQPVCLLQFALALAVRRRVHELERAQRHHLALADQPHQRSQRLQLAQARDLQQLCHIPLTVEMAQQLLFRRAILLLPHGIERFGRQRVDVGEGGDLSPQHHQLCGTPPRLARQRLGVESER
ncbi:MAG: hypothetical protein KatS3mg102_0863 [Planctomycetota bacterium]|nr:MAG: hypothetical protein KatS3mg102_0863 [Planctomycetota bacterium]